MKNENIRIKVDNAYMDMSKSEIHIEDYELKKIEGNTDAVFKAMDSFIQVVTDYIVKSEQLDDLIDYLLSEKASGIGENGLLRMIADKQRRAA